MSMTTYPLNEIEYTAEDAELYFCTRSSGVYSGEDFACSVSGADNVVTVGEGICWIQNGRFSGKVAANKEPEQIDMGIADALLPRIDSVVIRFSLDSNGSEIVSKRGEPASSPVPPTVTRTDSVYELHICHVRREAGAATISASDVKDLRFDPNYCGLMADPVTKIDTSAIAAQIESLISDFKKEIDDVGINGINDLLKSGPLVLSPNQYGYELPENPVNGQFFVLIKE